MISFQIFCFFFAVFVKGIFYLFAFIAAGISNRCIKDQFEISAVIHFFCCFQMNRLFIIYLFRKYNKISQTNQLFEKLPINTWNKIEFSYFLIPKVINNSPMILEIFLLFHILAINFRKISLEKHPSNYSRRKQTFTLKITTPLLSIRKNLFIGFQSS